MESVKDSVWMLRRGGSDSKGFTIDEDSLPASDVAPPVRQHIPAPLGKYEDSRVVEHHLGHGVDEILCTSRDFLSQTTEPRLKQDRGDTCSED